MSVKNSNILLLLGGEAPQLLTIPFDYHAIFAVDSGLSLCIDWQLTPNRILGDFDSFDLEKAKSHFPHATYKIFDKNKDYTDTELAIMEAIKESYCDITLIGGFGGRVDHFLHIYDLFKKYDAVSRWVGPHHQIQRVKKRVKLDTTYFGDKYVSFIPVTHKILPTKQKSRGLEWNLDDIAMDNTFSSISNEYVADEIEVEMQQGELFMIWAHHNFVQYGYV